MKKNFKYYLVVIIEKLSIYLAIVVLLWQIIRGIRYTNYYYSNKIYENLKQ